MAVSIEELRKDLAELESLEKQATRPKVRDALSLLIRKVSTTISTTQEEAVNQSGSKAPSVSVNKRYPTKLQNYAYDQNATYVKFYVTLDKVHTIPAENVSCEFATKSLNMQVKDLANKDYVFTINNLLYPINPAKSTWKVKTDMVLISVAKTKDATWSHITELEKKVSDSKTDKLKNTDYSDPNAGLMSIMKNMYDTGDDEMKRTIAKAWTEGQNKPTP